jgi:hypothetical protein
MGLCRSFWYGTIEVGKLHLDNKALFEEFVNSIKEPTRVELVLQNITKDKTSAQLRYWFGVLVAMYTEAFGSPKNEADGILKRMFLTVNRGTPKEYVKSKSELTCEEMSALIDEVVHWFLSQGIFICPPDRGEVK